MPPRKTNAERSEQTRSALLEAARGLFAERGYAATSTEDIIEASGVSRGALYHHFRDKRALFEAVDEQIEAELAASVVDASVAADAAPWEQMLAGIDAFLDSALDPAVRQIVLLDAPSVLGWARWREIDAEHGLGLLEGALRGAMERGEIADQPARPLAHLILAALSEACLYIAAADDPVAARAAMGRTARALFEGLRDQRQTR